MIGDMTSADLRFLIRTARGIDDLKRVERGIKEYLAAHPDDWLMASEAESVSMSISAIEARA